MDEFLSPGPVKRRALMAGDPGAARAEARRLFADHAAGDAVVRQLDRAYPIDAMRAKRLRGAAYGGRDCMARAVLDVLRRATRPPAAAEVGRRVVEPRRPGSSGRAERGAMGVGAGRALEIPRLLGTVRNPAKQGRAVSWRPVE